jgi:16S rRNA (cytidine1402-2'-O)-methyltransferase
MKINPIMLNHPGTLYIVATPIGNLQDMSQRAIEILQTVNSIAAEDTRHSAYLLQHFSIKTALLSCHEHNETKRTAQLLSRLQQGESIALISDAGTPLISDPGYILVREARNLGIRVVPIPGPCAAIAALSAAGLPTDRFVFEGFLPAKTKLRRERLMALCGEPRTIIFYEAPHRILDFLQELQKVLGGERQMAIARELTKLFETIHAGTISEMITWITADANQQRGEIIVLVAGVEAVSPIENTISAEHVFAVLLKALPLKQAAELVAKITGERKNALYQRALQIKDRSLK